jgi:PhnB protein
MGARGTKTLGDSPVMLYLYVKDVDAVVDQAVAAGAKLLHPVKDQFYGNRSGGLEDPFGHLWHIATRKEHVPPKAAQARRGDVGRASEIIESVPRPMRYEPHWPSAAPSVKEC